MSSLQLDSKTLGFIETTPLPFLVNGQWLNSSEEIAVSDPATSQVIATIAAASPDDVENAVSAGEQAFKLWGCSSVEFRAQCLRKLSQLIMRDQQVLAELECIDVGKPVSAALGFDVPFAADCFEYYAGVVENAVFEVDLGLSVTDSQTIKRPYGVAGFVFPWNFPLTLCAWGIGPALAAGNTVVIKPASETPLSTLYLGKLCLEAGFPAGVVNILPGRGSVTGEALISHPRVKLMSFTGSTEVGRHVGEVCGANLVPAKLELGGKGAAIVCADADLDASVEGLCGAVSLNAGQVCCTASRWYIHESIFDQFVAKAIANFEAIVVKRGLEADAQMGPICTTKQLKHVLACIADAQAHGARVLCGGKRLHGEGLENGNFIEPTLLTGSDDNPWAQEEIFGPVAFLLKFSDEQEVLERANLNTYGLANSVWKKDLDKARALAHQLVGGNTWINAHNVFEYGLHYGACNKSGCGGGVNSLATFEGYLRHQSIAAIR